MSLANIKANEKLPRGTFLYIRVGDRFYAGEAVTIVEDEVKKPYRNDWEWWRDKYSQSQAKFYRTMRRKKIPGYQVMPDPTPREPQKSVTGSRAKLTDDFKEVKQFRRRNQAELACKKLEAVYGGLDIRIAIELHKGDK